MYLLLPTGGGGVNTCELLQHPGKERDSAFGAGGRNQPALRKGNNRWFGSSSSREDQSEDLKMASFARSSGSSGQLVLATTRRLSMHLYVTTARCCCCYPWWWWW